MSQDTIYHEDSPSVIAARRYQGGEKFNSTDVDQLWQTLEAESEFTYAARVIEKYRKKEDLIDDVNFDQKKRDKLCQQLALCISKDTNLSAATRHKRALDILKEHFSFDNWQIEDAVPPEKVKSRQETLGIAGGIYKRWWEGFGRTNDLHKSLHCYERGYQLGVRSDYGYTAINTAFVSELLASLDENVTPKQALERRERAKAIREDIVTQLCSIYEEEGEDWLKSEWWYYATMAEAYFGLKKYDLAIEWIVEGRRVPNVPFWEYQVTARQFVNLAGVHESIDTENAKVREVLKALTGSDKALESVVIGKVGLALSGGGYRASLFHLGVLARLAELNVLRHIDVLSCVSGGSIVGAAYYLELRKMLMARGDNDIEHADYIKLVERLIERFVEGVNKDLRNQLKPAWTLFFILPTVLPFAFKHGILNPRQSAKKLEEFFYRPQLGSSIGAGPIPMYKLNFQPPDHDPNLNHQGSFNPRTHNWRRANKVPALVLNATTVNTGHNWQFTTTWMGESPYALNPDVNCAARLRRPWYDPKKPNLNVSLGEAVAASACVPMIFQPLVLKNLYVERPKGRRKRGKPFHVRLIDGGVYDNQGTISTLAQDCNVVLVSDAAGQPKVDNKKRGGLLGPFQLFGHLWRTIDMLMGRIRDANFSELRQRKEAGLLREATFVHMHLGLEADPVDWVGCEEPSKPHDRSDLTECGIRRDFQEHIAQLRTDLDRFSPIESNCLMACGYQMAVKMFQEPLKKISRLTANAERKPQSGTWIFGDALNKITDRANLDKEREQWLRHLKRGSKVLGRF